jgi:hypothetical protein
MINEDAVKYAADEWEKAMDAQGILEVKMVVCCA